MSGSPTPSAGDVQVYSTIGTDLGVTGIDPADPPKYESEATYLDRLSLLLPGERSRLRKQDFEPESVVEILGLDLGD